MDKCLSMLDKNNLSLFGLMLCCGQWSLFCDLKKLNKQLVTLLLYPPVTHTC